MTGKHREVSLLGLFVATAGASFAVVASVNAWRRLGRLRLPIVEAIGTDARLGSASGIRQEARVVADDAPLGRLVTAIDTAQTPDQARAQVNLVLSDVDAQLRVAVAGPGPAARVAVTSGILGAVLELIPAARAGGAHVAWALWAVGVGGAGALVALESARRARRASQRLRERYDALIDALCAPFARTKL